MKKLFTVTVMAFVILTNSCKKYVPAPEAFFIQPSFANVAITSSLQGSSSSKITDLFLYVDGKYQGVYQPSNKLPIVTKGQRVTINIFAGIKNNGISETVITWPFLNKIEIDTTVAGGITVNRGFSFNYSPNVNFMYKEDFDGGSNSIIKSSNTAANSTFTTTSASGAFEGNSAHLDVNANILAQVETAATYNIPHATSNVYLELNYKCDVKVEIGIMDANGLNKKNVITLNEKAEWNKIYIQLADAVNREPSYNATKIFFKADNPNQLSGVHVWLDNIKLIHL